MLDNIKTILKNLKYEKTCVASRHSCLSKPTPTFRKNHINSGKFHYSMSPAHLTCQGFFETLLKDTHTETERDMARELVRNIERKKKRTVSVEEHSSWLISVFIKDPIKQQATIWNSDHSVENEINVQKIKKQLKS